MNNPNDSATASDFDRLKQQLEAGQEAQALAFAAGEAIELLVQARARLVDGILNELWQQVFGDRTDIALVAVGGYGRGELHPASDIDLLVLHETDARLLEEPIGSFLAQLWDMGLEVGQSLRTLDECVHEASADVTVATNLMESRLLAGSIELFMEMRRLTGPDRIWPSEAFFAAKLEEQQRRHATFGSTSYNLEPNIKEGPGGLRDIQNIGWVAKRHYGEETMFGLVQHGFLTQEEYQSLMQGQELLWRIRFALHLLAGRKEDRLLFDYQRTLARQFGHEDDLFNLGVEHFMQNYYRAIMELNRLNDMLLQLFREVILLHGEACTPEPINERFQSCNGWLEMRDPEVFSRQPQALLEIFLLLAQRPELEGVRADTIRLIRQHRHLIDEGFRSQSTSRQLFIDILRQPHGCARTLMRMNRYGILAAYLPAFANIVGRMQYDLFHAYTVDEHSLFVVRNLDDFVHQRSPWLSEQDRSVARLINKPELLYLAGLFHDIAKGRGGDHSILGETDALEFCRQHLESEAESQLVAWLVRHHLIMSITVQRRDISDPEVIQDFAALVQSPERLAHLYLLSLADGQATNPGRWSTWKQSLLRELYLATQQRLEFGLHQRQDQAELAESQRQHALEQLLTEGLDKRRIEALWHNFSHNYFLYNDIEEILRQTRLILGTQATQLPLVNLSAQDGRGISEVLIYAHDRKQLFAIITGLLDRLALNVVDARIQTTKDGYALHSYKVLEQDATPVKDAERKAHISRYLQQGLQFPEQLDFRTTRRMARQLKHFEVATTIQCDSPPDQRHSRLQITTGDRPGLLARIGLGLADCGVRLHAAQITTVGATAEDSFHVTGPDGMTLSQGLAQQLIEALHKRLDDI